MPFQTKLDFSNNRQVKQHVETQTILSGGTSFGVPFSALTTGPDLTTSGITSTYGAIASTFSGNSGTTNYTWYDSRMSLGASSLSALTPSNSATTQNTGQVYVSSLSTTIDGNLVNLAYTGVSFDIGSIAMVDLGGGNYSGTVTTQNLYILSANSLDFTGRTIWSDVSGITRTERLIITNNPNVGYVWTCTDTEGMGSWQPSSGGTSGSSIWVSGSGISSAKLIGNVGNAIGNYSVSEGDHTTASGTSSHAEGSSTTAGGAQSHSEGSGTKAYGDTSHSEGSNTTANGVASHSEGASTQALGYCSHAEGNASIASGSVSHSEGQNSKASGDSSHAEGNATTASNSYAHAEGFFTIASGQASHAEGSGTTASGNYSHAGGVGSIASGYSNFVHGSGSTASGTGTIVLGNNITGTTDNTTYVASLNIKTVGSTAFANDIRIDANGNLTTNTSDERLKENINPLTNALDTIKSLSGVTYQWKDRNAGGNDVRLGFIAQQVESVEPKLVFTNKVDGYMGLHIDGIIPLLVEAVKEIAGGQMTGGVYLETQTILAEDNDIQLNYSGTQQTAIGGGLRVLHAMGQDQEAELITDSNGNWVTNNDLKPNALTIPVYTPTSSSDTFGSEGNITRDNNYLYLKTSEGWKRTNLESF